MSAHKPASGLKPPLKPARLRKAAPLILAGFVYAGIGGFSAETSRTSPGSAFTFLSAAMADDGRGHGGGGGGDGRGGGQPGDGGGNGGWGNGGGGGWTSHDKDSGNGDGDGQDSRGRDGGGGDIGPDPGRTSHAAPSSGDDHGSNLGGVSYDASRNMMTLGFKIGGGERRDSLEPGHRGWEPDHHERHEHEWEPEGHRRHEHDHFHDRERWKWRDRDDWNEEAATQSLNPIAANFAPQSGSFAPQSDTTVDSIATRDSTPTNYARPAPAQQNGRTAVENTSVAIGNSTFMPNEVLAVGLDPASIERAEALGFRADPQAMVSKATGRTITRFTVPPGLDALRGRELLSRELPSRRFELNMVYRLYRAAVSEDKAKIPDKDNAMPAPGNPSRCEADHCLARQAIGWNETLAPCARGLKVGVIDTDVDQSHPAFAGRAIHRFDFSPDGRGVPPNLHGTAVLSLLAGSPLGGGFGLIPDAEFFAANIFFSDELGEMAADTLSLLKALDWMQSFGVKLVNMSFSGPRDELVAEAIGNLSKKGLVFVAAAGNEGPTAPPSYPAAYPQVIAVTAVTKDLRNYRYANRGDHIDVAAPGVDIWTAMPGGRAGYQSGTSFAAPHVTAILAVNPRETLQQDKAGLLDGLRVIDLGEQGRDPVYGRGLLMAPSKCTPPWETTASNE